MDAITFLEQDHKTVYRFRSERATPVQRDVLRSLAAIGGDEAGSVADVARHMGTGRASGISVARTELIKKGLTTRRNGVSSPSRPRNARLHPPPALRERVPETDPLRHRPSNSVSPTRMSRVPWNFGGDPL